MKPARGSPNTNIHILTNKRVYNLDMVLAGPKEINYEFIQYRYPEDELQSRRAKGQADLVKKMLTQGDGRHQNENWTVEGATTIEPVRVVDNGLATYVTFPLGPKFLKFTTKTRKARKLWLTTTSMMMLWLFTM